MSFVTAYDHDIFVSYAHVDDLSRGSELGWVSAFIEDLRIALAQKLGRVDAYDLWFDRGEMHRHEGVTGQIRVGVECSATFLVVLSPGYMASPWCQREKDAFLKFVHGRARSGARLFVVERESFERDQMPEEFSRLPRYKFWVKRPGTPPRTLRTCPEDEDYSNAVNDLAVELANELKRLKSAEEREAPVREVPVVYLAEVADEINHLRDGARRYFQQAGLEVLPARNAPRNSADLHSELAKDLERSRLFVQLLSAITGDRSPDLPGGYCGLQLEEAQARKVPVLQWRHPDLDLLEILDSRDRSLLEGEAVHAVGIEEFKRTVVERAFAEEPRPKTRNPGVLVFVDREGGDSSLADLISKELIRQGVGYATPLDEGTPAERREDLRRRFVECEALIVVYGSSPPSWVREQLSFLRRVLPERGNLPVLAIYEGPPEEKGAIGFEVPGQRTIDGRHGLGETELSAFITEIKEKVAR